MTPNMYTTGLFYLETISVCITEKEKLIIQVSFTFLLSYLLADWGLITGLMLALSRAVLILKINDSWFLGMTLSEFFSCCNHFYYVYGKKTGILCNTNLLRIFRDILQLNVL